MRFSTRSYARAAVGLAAGLSLAVGGTAMASTHHSIKKGLLVYAIPKDTVNPYEVIADNGIKKALGQLGGKVVVSSGTQDTAAAQQPGIQAAIQAHANAIIIAADDPSALCPQLAQAQAAGIKVISFDSDVTCKNHLFINQANTKQIGTSEVDLLGKEIGYKG
ncbi:MAG TPA: substrate-binding domain-containing protein, partial [Solirubrobacteraceae bacterium]|nr:substrate-binding domain-containing protein [Solirubrobacteraceae bacterium]